MPVATVMLSSPWLVLLLLVVAVVVAVVWFLVSTSYSV